MYFLFTITIRLEVQFVVFLCNIITRNESFNSNSPLLSCKAPIEMLQMTLFVAMHPILTGILPRYFTLTINNYELYSYWIIPNQIQSFVRCLRQQRSYDPRQEENVSHGICQFP